MADTIGEHSAPDPLDYASVAAALRAQRRRHARALQRQGLSVRGVATALGVAVGTAHADLRQPAPTTRETTT